MVHPPPYSHSPVIKFPLLTTYSFYGYYDVNCNEALTTTPQKLVTCPKVFKTMSMLNIFLYKVIKTQEFHYSNRKQSNPYVFHLNNLVYTLTKNSRVLIFFFLVLLYLFIYFDKIALT